MIDRRQRYSTFILLFISSTKENDLQTEKGKASMAKMKLKPYMGKKKKGKKQPVTTNTSGTDPEQLNNSECLLIS